MSRREGANASRRGRASFSRVRVLAAVAFAAGGFAASCSREAPQIDLHPIPRQNVLLVTIDTLRADALGSYGGPASTPALDRIASEGVRFDFAHAHAVVTLTSHASILTGLYPFQHGLRDNSGYRLPAGARTAATLLRAAGYSTAAFVAGFPLHSRFGLNQGFDVYDDRFGDTRAPTEFGMPERPASAVVPLARAWIAQQVQHSPTPQLPNSSIPHPWFLWLHVFDPHAPYRPPAPFDSTYAGRPYYGEVAAVDAALAPLVDDVRASRRATLVIVTADHGEALGDHGEQSHGLFAYESTLRVPFILAELPRDDAARASAGEVSSVSARHIDILPTLLDAVGVTVPGDLPGRSLLPAAERRGGDPTKRVAYFEAMGAMLNRGWAPLTGVLVDRDKFIDLPVPERYDLRVDPGEASNIDGRLPERDRSLQAALAAFRAPMPGARVAESADAAARLQALGYVSGSATPKAHYAERDDPKRLVEIDQALHRAVDAFASGRSAEAARIYGDVIARRPDMALAYRHLAFIQSQGGHIADAIATLRSAVGHGITDVRLIAQLGEALADSGNVKDAIRVLEPLTASTDADVEALNALGISYAGAGRKSDARRVFERVAAADPASPVPLENLGMLALEEGDLATARQRFDAAMAANPRSSRAHAGAGLVALRSGQRDAAIAEWTRAVELDPRNFDALYNLATTLARIGRPDEARPYLDQYLQTAPSALFPRERAEIRALVEKRP